MTVNYVDSPKLTKTKPDIMKMLHITTWVILSITGTELLMFGYSNAQSEDSNNRIPVTLRSYIQLHNFIKL